MENTSYFIFSKRVDGFFEATPVEEWHNFKSTVTYNSLNADEAEEEFARFADEICITIIDCSINKIMPIGRMFGVWSCPLINLPSADFHLLANFSQITETVYANVSENYMIHILNI